MCELADNKTLLRMSADLPRVRGGGRARGRGDDAAREDRDGGAVPAHHPAPQARRLPVRVPPGARQPPENLIFYNLNLLQP